MNLDECLGLGPEEAAELLKAQGIEYRVKEITPFYKGQKKPDVEGGFSIVRARFIDGVAELTVCRIPGGNIDG